MVWSSSFQNFFLPCTDLHNTNTQSHAGSIFVPRVHSKQYGRNSIKVSSILRWNHLSHILFLSKLSQMVRNIIHYNRYEYEVIQTTFEKSAGPWSHISFHCSKPKNFDRRNRIHQFGYREEVHAKIFFYLNVCLFVICYSPIFRLSKMGSYFTPLSLLLILWPLPWRDYHQI